MAVSVDTVYQRVLAILNKEQRGYLTPQEFNLFANQAQMDIFEQYFYDINQFSRLPGNSTEYSDMLDVLNEKISAFEAEGAVTGGITLPADLYRLGSVKVSYVDPITAVSKIAEAERVTKNEYLYITLSPLAAPTVSRPIYTRDESQLKVYGGGQLTTGVTCNYIKTPTTVEWNYTMVLGTAQYNASTSTNFPLHQAEEQELIEKILEMSGMLLKDPSIYQYANAEETERIQQEKA
ncbi:MAG: hypothetical protein E4H07_05325 [Nitrosomonadales bacterium]|jgi:hypothetical protein|nr:MAG: hypothetical protein E4H07_05325 [Nitrosomonadales bacterium]|tara:strand:- start:354 stop:1061 length:708 start_codon:yes stop_codon:yes gene_type:complete